MPLETEAEQPAGAFVHWRLSQMPGEIMTTYTGRSPDRPEGGALSAITLGALIDIGYAIRLSAADPYRVDTRVPDRMPTVAGIDGHTVILWRGR